MSYFLLIAMSVSFLTTYLLAPVAAKYLRAAGIIGLDLHKKNKPKLASSGGVIVAFGILSGLFLYIGLETFLNNNTFITVDFLAVTSSILIVTFIGFLDDLNIRSRVTSTKDGKDIRIGVSQWMKPLLTLFAAIPLMASACSPPRTANVGIRLTKRCPATMSYTRTPTPPCST